MIIYNVTVKVLPEIHDEWLSWMKEIHIPEVLATGCFIENKICQVLLDETDGVTYSIQYTANSMEDYEHYSANFAAQLQKDHTERYKDKFVAFRTLLDIVHTTKNA